MYLFILGRESESTQMGDGVGGAEEEGEEEGKNLKQTPSACTTLRS